MATTKETSVQECEEYIEQHGIQGLLKEVIAKLCQERPPNPYRFLSNFFDKLDKASANKINTVSTPLAGARVFSHGGIACGGRHSKSLAERSTSYGS